MSVKAFLPSGDQALVALSDLDAPTPPVDEALVAVEAFSVNRGEILLPASGRQDPPGKDIAGRVVEAADRDVEDLATLVHLVATGRLHPEIGEIADWIETPRVLASVRDRRVRGNAVLTLTHAA